MIFFRHLSVASVLDWLDVGEEGEPLFFDDCSYIIVTRTGESRWDVFHCVVGDDPLREKPSVEHREFWDVAKLVAFLLSHGEWRTA